MKDGQIQMVARQLVFAVVHFFDLSFGMVGPAKIPRVGEPQLGAFLKQTVALKSHDGFLPPGQYLAG